MNRSTPGLPAHHQLPQSTQTHVHQVGDAIQPSHPLSSPSPPALNLSASGSFQMSQLFASDGQSIGVLASKSVLPMNTQDWFPLGWTGWISLQPKGLLNSVDVFNNNKKMNRMGLILWVRVRFDAFELWSWRRLLRVPWTARRYTQSILKEISPGRSLEGLMLKLKSNTLAT